MTEETYYIYIYIYIYIYEGHSISKGNVLFDWEETYCIYEGHSKNKGIFLKKQNNFFFHKCKPALFGIGLK